MSVSGVAHIAVVVKDLEVAIEHFEAVFGRPCSEIEDVDAEDTRVAFFHLGSVRFELISPKSADSALGRSLARRGEGLHHVCLDTPDIEPTLEAMQARGLEIVGDGVRTGAGGCKVAFLHPRGLHGVLFELSQAPAEPTD
jgi:methylmalonyl-CoA/ethylmalonyl-CoA epimerase